MNAGLRGVRRSHRHCRRGAGHHDSAQCGFSDLIHRSHSSLDSAADPTAIDAYHLARWLNPT
jgi:hypothetical protein